MLTKQHLLKGEHLMCEYVILTDSGADLPAAVAKEYGISVIDLVLQITGQKAKTLSRFNGWPGQHNAANLL